MPELNEEKKKIELTGIWLWIFENWKTVIKWTIPIISTLGVTTYFNEIKTNAVNVWNMPSIAITEINLSRHNDSIHKKEIYELQYEILKLREEIKILKYGINGVCEVAQRETTPTTYKGIRLYLTDPNPRTGVSSCFIFVNYKDKKITIPYEMKYNPHTDGYEYWDLLSKEMVEFLPQ